jgi:archaeosine synthase beta-subunit
MTMQWSYPQNPSKRTRWIRSLREAGERPDASSLPELLLEHEIGPTGRVCHSAIVFLINRECPWTCVMCDLWKNTSPGSMPAGHATEQLDKALERLDRETSTHLHQIKIYNSGSFFDSGAIRPAEYKAIARLLSRFERVIVECHPRLINERVTMFKGLLPCELEVAMGLEIACDRTLGLMNKRFTLADYTQASKFLHEADIRQRAFIMVQPPFVTPENARNLCLQSVQYAFQSGASCISLIPTRAQNTAMHVLQSEGLFSKPSIRCLEQCFRDALELKQGRVFADLWDLEHFNQCKSCSEKRSIRLSRMNDLQVVLPEITCNNCLCLR